MTLQTAKKTAFIYFVVGTLLFFLHWFSVNQVGIHLIGIVFLLFAVVHNLIGFFILVFQLIKRDELETFFSILIILLNITVVIGYGYILFNYS